MHETALDHFHLLHYELISRSRPGLDDIMLRYLWFGPRSPTYLPHRTSLSNFIIVIMLTQIKLHNLTNKFQTLKWKPLNQKRERISPQILFSVGRPSSLASPSIIVSITKHEANIKSELFSNSYSDLKARNLSLNIYMKLILKSLELDR